MLTAGGEKIRSLNFVYHKAKMQTTSSYSYGRGATAAYTGFEEFGGVLVKEAEAAFSARKVAVLAASEADGNQPPIPAGGVAGDAAPVLVVSPLRGEVHANNHATRISFVFSARLVDPRNRRVIWQATLDTSTWSGQDFLMKHADKTLYDETYARQFLKALGDRMAEDGAI